MGAGTVHTCFVGVVVMVRSCFIADVGGGAFVEPNLLGLETHGCRA